MSEQRIASIGQSRLRAEVLACIVQHCVKSHAYSHLFGYGGFHAEPLTHYRCLARGVDGCDLGTEASTESPAAPAEPVRQTESLNLIGCLRPAEAVMGQSEQTAGGTPNPLETVRVRELYVLTDVEANVLNRPPVPSGTPNPPAPTNPTSSAHNTYYVTAKDGSVRLADHLNHKVQVSGTISVEPKTPATSSTSTSSAAPQVKPGGDKSSTLVVSSISMVAPACTTLH